MYLKQSDPLSPIEEYSPLSLALVQREMAQPTPPPRYFTADGFPPNHGVPYHRLFTGLPTNPQPGPSAPTPAAAPPPRRRYHTTDGLPPNQGLPLHPPSAETSEEKLLLALLARLQIRISSQATVSPKPTDPTPTDPLSFLRQDALYLFPEAHVTVYFLYAGQRPCDHKALWTEYFPYKVVKLPLTMTVGEVARRLGNPGRDLQEMVELIQPVRYLHQSHPTLCSCHDLHSFVVTYTYGFKRIEDVLTLIPHRDQKERCGVLAGCYTKRGHRLRRRCRRLGGSSVIRMIRRGLCMDRFGCKELRKLVCCLWIDGYLRYYADCVFMIGKL